MINEINLKLADRSVRLSKEVRDFCEAAKNAEDREAIQFKTLADAWVYLVLHCADFDDSIELEWHPGDAFRWRTVRHEWCEPLLLRALCLHGKVDFENLENAGQLIDKLQIMAHLGLSQLTENRNSI